MKPSKSERVISALLQLGQFVDAGSSNSAGAFHMLTGALVSAHPQADEDDAILILQFPSGPEVEVIGDIYLQLQIAESAAHEIHLEPDNKNPIAIRSAELLEHLTRKYDF